MAYILLALGMAMSIAGLAAMAIGYPMIEIERGWATLITGSVLLSGGLVVVALGFVVRHLIGLRGALTTLGGALHAAEAPIPQSMAVQAPLMPSTSGMPAPSRPELWPSGPATLAPKAAPALAAAVPVAATALAAGALHGHDAHETGSEAHPDETYAVEPPRADDIHPAHADVAEGHVLEDHVPDHHDPEQAPPPSHALGHEPAESFAAEPSPPAEPGRPMSTEDLLDQAFSAFDYEMANGHPPANEAAPAHDAHHREPTAPDMAHEVPLHEAEVEAHPGDPHEHEPLHAEPETPETHEPPAAEAPATAPAEPAANLTVIGRYDSEGTSYVMYSDGSIEAQSEGGIHRFSSMADLKAFIEG